MFVPGWLDRTLQDLRQSRRVLGKSWVFTGVAVLSLALGIGANTALFSLVNAVLLRTLPVEDPERLVQFTVGADQASMTNTVWEALRDRQQVLDGMFAVSRTRFDLASGGEKQLIDGLYVSGDFFRTLGIQPVAGRTIGRDDDRRGGGGQGPVAMISHDYWRTRYGASPEALGSVIRLEGQPFTIIGVTPQGFFGTMVGSRFDVAVPLGTESIIRGPGSMLDRRTSFWLTVLGRLKPGQSVTEAEAGLRTLAPSIREAAMPQDYVWPEQRDGFLREPFTLTPASAGSSSLRNTYRTALLTLMAAVIIVLLIACANLANLLLARASARQKEFALRLALGASRRRLVRQLLTESLLLAVGGAILGLLFARWASALLVRQISSTQTPVFLDLSLDWTVLAFTSGIAILSALLFGLLPAFRATDLGAGALLKSQSRSIAASWRGITLEKGLVILQIGCSLVLVLGAALFVRSFTSLATLSPGFDPNDVLVVSVDIKRANYPPDRRLGEARRLLDNLRALPGVRGGAATVMVPITRNSWTAAAHVPQRQSFRGRVYMNRVSPQYFATLGTPILAGRDFSTVDTPQSPPTAIVNEMFARTFFDGANPVGQRLELSDLGTTPVEIVGLVKDSKYLNLREAVPETVYLSMGQETAPRTFFNFVLRSSTDTGGLVRSVTAAARDVSKDFVLEFRAFDTIVQESVVQERLLAILAGFFGALVLLIASIGLYGVMSLAVARRRAEIGIRMALGASPAEVVRMVFRDVITVTLLGVAIGVVSGLVSGRLVAALLFELAPTDVMTWLMAISALMAAAALAGYLPARRAARVDPLRAMQEE